jgi:hypothetical protein
MQRIQPTKDRRTGNALVTVLGVVSVVSAFLIMTVGASLNSAHRARKLSDRIQAQAIAEAGACDSYIRLQTDFTLRTNAVAFPLTDYRGGTYDVAVTAVGDEHAVIESVGCYAGITETVILDTKMLTRETEVVVPSAYGYAILVDGTIRWQGCGVFGGDSRVHGNDQFTQSGCGELNADCTSHVGVRLNGKSGEIDGDVAAPWVKGKTGKITGTITKAPVDVVPVPEIDLVPYYNHALANNEVHNGSQTLSGSYDPVGGIMWVNGDLHLSGSATRTGCFIATGDIKLSGSAGQRKVADYPGFLSRDGAIKLSGSGDYEGLIYARIGDIEITGGGSLTGSIICGGNFKKAGSSTVISYVESVPVAPTEVASEGILCISAWQK